MLEALKSAMRRFRLEIKVWQLVLVDSRTPSYPNGCLGLP